MSSLEEVWEQREGEIYPKRFGPESEGIFTLKADLFAKLGQKEVDPRWLHVGLFEFAPTEERRTWVYVSSGLSNPWDTPARDYDPEGYSEIGTELVMETPDQAAWALEILARLTAFNLLLAAGRMGEAPPLDYGHRVPLRASIDITGDSALRSVMAWRAEHYEANFVLDSGRVDLLHFVGISDAELDFAKAEGSDKLAARLIDGGAFPVTDPRRASLI
ncbi:suppressor of fused domain protein [Pelagibius sp.]|uniref:suppressor of fused domain protein n=1 Tax=Pelagibius sp. TaxID=1931238 RepID=UPI00262CFE86|nr:suppressor of fused domain protein [Pelagibius sp.]